MLDGGETLIAYHSEVDEFGRIVSEIFSYDLTGDETADMQAVYKYTHDGISGFPHTEILVDYGIDGTVDVHSLQWWTSSSEGLVDHSKSAFDSDGDGVFDKFDYTSLRAHRTEIQDYLDSNIVYYRATYGFDDGNFLTSIVEEFDSNGDGQFEQRVSTTYEYSDDRACQLTTVTTETDADGDGIFDTLSVVTSTPGESFDDETGIGEDAGGEGEGIGDDSSDPNPEETVPPDSIADDVGDVIISCIPTENDTRHESGESDVDSESLFQASSMPSTVDNESLTGSNFGLSESINWLAYLTVLDAADQPATEGGMASESDSFPLQLETNLAQ
jgi:hypothetical protein